MPAKLERRSGERVPKATISLPGGVGELSLYPYGGPGDPVIAVKPPRGGSLEDSTVTVHRALDAEGREYWLVKVYLTGKFGTREEYTGTHDLEDAVYTALGMALNVAEHVCGKIDEEVLKLRIIVHIVSLMPVRVEEIDKKYKLTMFTPIEARRVMHAVEKAVKDLGKVVPEVLGSCCPRCGIR